MTRLFALAIDSILFCALFFPITRGVKGVWLMRAADHAWSHGWIAFDPICLVFLVAIFGYYVLAEAYAGGTAGKRLVGIRVVGVDGGRVGLARSLLRNLLRMIDALPVLNILGVILIARSPQNARLGDRVAGTRVIHAR